MPTEVAGYRVELTEKAANVIRQAFEAEKVDLANGFVRVGAKPGGCSGFKYDMGFAERAQVTEGDAVFTSQGINVVVDKACLTDVLGSVQIDYQDTNLIEQGFKFKPLDAQGGVCGCGESFQAVKARA
jgi:iron-sulfur cluster assembly protein